MRVHLGSDHAGLELKEHLLNWLADHGYEAVDHGPFVYDALDDYPVFCLRAAEAAADEDGSLGVVIGGSGNGEAIAANKVKGVRAALVWSEETAVLAREHNDANVISVGGRMHTVEDMTRFVEVFLDHRLHRRGAAHPPDRMLADYEKTGNLPPLPESALGHRPGRSLRCPRGTPSSGSPRTLSDHFAGRVVSVTSPQGRFAESARADRRDRAGRPPSPTASTCSWTSSTSGIVHVHLGLYGKFVVRDGAAADPAARSGCGWWPTGPTSARRRTATCAAPRPAS